MFSFTIVSIKASGFDVINEKVTQRWSLIILMSLHIEQLASLTKILRYKDRIP